MTNAPIGASFAGWISQRYGRKPTLVLAAILFLLSAIGSAWPELFVGINVVLYYAPEIFKTMGAATDAALLQQIVVGAVNLSFTVLAIFTVDRFGRRPLMIIGALVMAVSMRSERCSQRILQAHLPDPMVARKVR